MGRSRPGVDWQGLLLKYAPGYDAVSDRRISFTHYTVQLLGPACVAGAMTSFAFSVWTFLIEALPQISSGWPEKAAIVVVGLFLLCNALYNYAMTIVTDPGTPPLYKDTVPAGVEEDGLGLVKPESCQRCERLKPPRTHHCSICNRCVLKMDHHCPWVDNCVGFGNYRYFVLFKLFLWASCGYVVVVFLAFFGTQPLAWRAQLQGEVFTIFVLCLLVFAILTFLGGFHAYLVATNQTTIEFQRNVKLRREARRNGEEPFVNPYDLGCRRNLQEVFGPSSQGRWLFPYLALAPVGSGMDFPPSRPPEDRRPLQVARPPPPCTIGASA